MTNFTKELYTGKLTVEQLPHGGVWYEPGSSLMRKTGDWKIDRPVHNKEKCVNCLTCWAYCPDSCILVQDNKIQGYDYDHCKGCGICAAVCPPKVSAITMEKAR